MCESAGPAPRRPFRTWLPAIGIGVVLAYLVALPLLLVVVSSFKPTGFPLDPGLTLANYAKAYGDPGFPGMLGTTFAFALGSTAVALVLGIGLAWATERSDIPCRDAVRTLVLIPMATPPILLAIAWAMLASPRNGTINIALMSALGLSDAPFDVYTLSGMIFVQGLAMVPTAYLLLAPAFANMDPSLEEAATTSGAGAFSLMRRVILPILAPQIVAAGVFLLIVALVVFDIPGALGTPARQFVLSTRIYSLVSSSPTSIPLYGEVSALAMMFLAMLAGLGLAYQRLSRHAHRYRTVTGKGFRPRTYPLGRGKPLAILALAIYGLAAVIAPFLVLLWMSLMPYQAAISWASLDLLTLDNHRDFLNNRRVIQSTVNSLTIAVTAATVVAALAIIVSWSTVRLKVPGSRALDMLALVPIAVPGVMTGVALIYVYITLGSALPIYGTIWIIAIAYVTQYLPFGVRTTSGMMMQLHPELEEAGAMSGAGKLGTLRSITLPLVWPAIAAGWIWVLAHALRELSSALMLQGRTNGVIPTLIWDYWTGGEPTKAAAAGLWLTLVLVAMLAGWRQLARRSGLDR